MASTGFAPSRGAPRETRRPHDRRPNRLRRIAIVASLVALLPAGISYVSAMSGPSNTALGVRSVEWLRDNGAAGIVGQIENWYYTLTAPSKGGPGLKALPTVGKTVVEFKKGIKGLEDEVETAHSTPAKPSIEPEPIRPPQRITASAPKFEDDLEKRAQG